MDQYINESDAPMPTGNGYPEVEIDPALNQLAENITKTVVEARSKVAQTINSTLTNAYWNVGRYIVEYEQGGKAQAKYGTALMTNLAKLLRIRLGKGYSRSNLQCMRRFYILYPSYQSLSAKLSWSHICELLMIDDDLERSFYEKECIAENWNVRSLRRQIDSALYLRVATSKDKDSILKLANKGIVVSQPEDVIKNTYTFEFLGLPKNRNYNEQDIEQKIIDNLQVFLLELGKGFAFVGRQYPLTINNRHYHIDLVFYHMVLKCYVLIDLKTNTANHKDIGQMNMYMGYFAKEENSQSDNAPVGIILSRAKDDLLVEYATYGMDSNLFVSKYELYLPNKEELKRVVDGIVNNTESL